MKKYIVLLFLLLTICNLQVLSKEKATIKEYAEAIVQALKANNISVAGLLIEQFQKDYPDDGNPYFFLAAMNYPKNCQSVFENTSKALSLGVDTETSAVAKVFRGVCYFQQDALDSALQELNLISPEEYNFLSAAEKTLYHNIKAQCLFSTKEDYEGTIYNMTRALEYEVSPEFYFFRGIAYAKLNELEKTKMDFKRQKELCSDPKYRDTSGCEIVIEFFE